ncbi:RNA-directed DNA polymerase, eukaryota [Tanacetum coccineum]
MGSYRTKEDDVARISTSVFITNFPDSISAKELFQACMQYGHVVDSYIPFKRTKFGKRFGFVRPTGMNEGDGTKKPFVDTKVEPGNQTIVLGDECVRTKNTVNALFGRVKEFASLANLKMALGNEGFMDIVIKYMGELWVMMEFKSVDSMSKFRECVSVMSWFSQIMDASNEFEVEGRIAWVEVEGVPFRLWTENSFARIADKWGKLLDVDDQDETCFHSKRLCVYTKSGKSIREDFKVIHRGKTYWIRANETPGWVPDFTEETAENILTLDERHKERMKDIDNLFVPNIQGLAQKVKKDWVKELSIKNKVNFLAIQETKMEKIDEFCVKQCWGNLVFDYAYSEAVGNSGGILCVWDTNSFCKSSVTVSDYFVINRGHWRSTGKNMMIIAVYAPQESKEKQSLWDFLHHEIGKWNGDVIIMGDFNEMSKLDRFLVSESVLSGNPNINAITLERFLSDHRPILLKDNRYDYGPTPFRFFHHWLDMDGFNVFVENTWKNSPRVGPNALSSLMSKLRILKQQIRSWNKNNMGRRKNEQTLLKKKLEDIDLNIDSGLGNDDLINSRLETIHQLQKLDSLESMERAQKISYEQQAYLESDVTNAEIKKAVWECGIDKAPGPDGFTFGFFRHFWYLVDIEVFEAVRIGKKQTFLFKVDFEKAYDSVRWDFLDDILSKFGFGEKWRKWIHCCLHSSKGSIIINGSPTEEFQFGKGLKQGDPLSPFLFLLVMETLHISFQRVVDEGMYQGIKVGGLINLSHMFYADDAVFVGEWSESNISSLIHVLDCFHKVSGLKINMSKSKLMGIEVEAGKVSRAAVKLGCLVLKAPFLYLGSYVGGDMHRLQSWEDIVDRVRRRLSKWKMKMLSIGGRLTLIKSVLGSMPIFHMSMFKVPTGILRILESIRGKFFNGHETYCKKASWVQWNKVLAPKVIGGLGISSLYALNRGLLFKWVWRFFAHESTLWSRVVKAIHGDDGNIDGVSRKGVNTCWTSIINEVKVLANKGINLMSFMQKKMGNGLSTLFWEDGWCEGGKFKERFPRAYALENLKRITVGSKLTQPCLTHSFRRNSPIGVLEESQSR